MYQSADIKQSIATGLLLCMRGPLLLCMRGPLLLCMRGPLLLCIRGPLLLCMRGPLPCTCLVHCTCAVHAWSIAPVHAWSIALVSKHYLSKALIQLPRNIEDHAVAHFAFFFILQSILYRESLQNWWFLFYGQTIVEKHKIPLGLHGNHDQ